MTRPSKRRVLHLLSQRPSLTGSGITLDALLKNANERGWSQRAIFGTPSSDPSPKLAALDTTEAHPLLFDSGDLDFPLPGMSDIMPYRSTVFASMTASQISRYVRAWHDHMAPVIEEFEPHVIHSHHVWLMSSLIKDIAPETPVVTHCHATGLRQMALCPNLAERARVGNRRNDRFAALHLDQARQLSETLRIPSDRVVVVGAGYREDLFHFAREADERLDRSGAVLYAGKLSNSKGLPWLLDAAESIARRKPGFKLHIAGGGSGAESEALLKRIECSKAFVVYHGRVDQTQLAELMRRCAVFVLPSFYEGLPLVLVEALACGCRLIGTELPAVTQELAPTLGDALITVPLPRLRGPDVPVDDDLPTFVDNLVAALEQGLESPLLGDPRRAFPGVTENFTWGAVFDRVESIWSSLID